MKHLVARFLLLCALTLAAKAAFIHPGLYHNVGDLAFMRQKIEARAEPWFGAWNELQAGGSLNWTPHPVADWDANADAYMAGDAVEAYRHALQWALTGDQAQADKAIEILNAWSTTLQVIHGTNSQERLVCGWNACHLANAAELLTTCLPPTGKSSGWAPADLARFRNLLGMMAKIMAPYKSEFNGNWDAAMMNSLLCIAVFNDDQALFDSVLDHFHGKYAFAVPNQRDNGHFTSYVLASGQCQEAGRDQGHVQLGLGNYLALCEVAWKQGVDLYGAEDNRLAKAMEYAAAYLLGHDDLPFEATPPETWTKISPLRRDTFLPIWETAYQHYVFQKSLPMPYVTQVVLQQKVSMRGKPAPGPYRPETANPLSGICWGTLTMLKGVGDPVRLTP